MTESAFGRGQHSPLMGETSGGANAALLVDFDNVTLGIRSDLQRQLKLIIGSDVIQGRISVQRAYADWRRYPQYIVPLSEASFDLIFAPAFGASKKNATDIRLAIDALELVFVRPEIGTYILLSGDSDFSSLVLKLKEYGKYVIGVGIRESASDLLIQNCDEYYSYTELTGFQREGVEEEPQRDPWALVVDAMVRMKERGDVMRSDRLKQVMQELDSHFSEKNVGFNKFSRFVVEAAKRGLLNVHKLENGQYEVEVGLDANVEPAVEATFSKTRARDQAGPEEVRTRAMNLAEAFGALKTTLHEMGSDNGPLGSEPVRLSLVERYGNNPVFSGNRYNRLLRQAHDAELIELVRDADNRYLLKLAARFVATSEDTSDTLATAQKTKPRARNVKKSAAARSEPGGPKKNDASEKAVTKKAAKKKKSVRRNPKSPRGSATPETKSEIGDPSETTDADGLLRRVSAVVNKAIRGERSGPDS
jgi:uncharacterized protein (TIGR00288 family)